MHRIGLSAALSALTLLPGIANRAQGDKVDATALLKKVSDTYRSAKSFQFVGTSVVETPTLGTAGTVNFPFKADFAAPTRFRIENDNSVMPILIVSDGHKAWIYSSSANTYSGVKLEMAEQNDERAQREGAIGAAGAAGLVFDVFQVAIAVGLRQAKTLAEEEIDLGGTKIRCHVVRAEYGLPNVPLPEIRTYWVDKLRSIVLREISVTNDNTTTTTLTQARFNEQVPDKLFKFTPPQGAIEAATPQDGAAGSQK